MQVSSLGAERILKRYEEKTRKSGELARAAAMVTPGGVMAGIKFYEPYPVFMRRGDGSKLTDVDGNRYIDYLMSYGALMLGHGSAVVKKAMVEVMQDRGTTVFGTPSEVEQEYGAILRDLYHPGGLVRFTNSGLEATTLAVRIAKAHTGKTKVAKFEGHYHGAVENLLVSYSPSLEDLGTGSSPRPVPDSSEIGPRLLSDTVVLPFNDWEGTESLLRANYRDLACVIMEPFEDGVIPADPAFMEELRGLTKDLGVPLVFDEVKTGFRTRIGGAGEFYSLVPDLTCLGKIVGGGFPIGALVGESEMMSLLDPKKVGPRVFHSGTFNGNPMSLGVGLATTRELLQGGFDLVLHRTSELRNEIASALRGAQLPFEILGEGGMLNFYLTSTGVKNYRDVKRSDLDLRRIIDIGLINEGVHLKPCGRFCLSTAHSEDDVKTTGESLAKVLEELAG